MFIPVFLLLIGTTGCGGGNKPSAEELITVDVTADYPEKDLILQDFMEVEYVPLETTDEFITQGVVEAVGEQVVVVRNWRGGDILIFDRAGKSLRKVNRRGQSGEEYSQLTGIILDEDRREMFVIDYPARKIAVYDLEGNFQRSFPFADTSYYKYIFNYDRDHLLVYKGYSPTVDAEQSGHLLISKHDGSIRREIPIPFKEIATPVILKGEISVTPRFYLTMPAEQDWLITRSSSDTIYRCLTDATIRPFMVRTPSIHAMDQPVFLFPGVISSDRYYFLQTMQKEVDFDTMKGFPTNDLVYDKQAGALFQCTVYNADFSNGDPVSLSSIPLNQKIATYQVLNAPDLAEAYGKGELKGRLKEIAATLDEESNPVIMLIKYKK